MILFHYIKYIEEITRNNDINTLTLSQFAALFPVGLSCSRASQYNIIHFVIIGREYEWEGGGEIYVGAFFTLWEVSFLCMGSLY